MPVLQTVVKRERNKTYYRVLHLPIWLWVFWILPGPLTYDLFTRGPRRWNWIWLGIVFVVCAWRGWRGRLPGVEPKPYIRRFGEPTPNLLYRRVCYTAAWIDLLAPWGLNLIGLLVAAFTGRWRLAWLYAWLYWPLALLVVAATLLEWTPRARRSTMNEGEERAWFYVAIWTVVPAQILAWAGWRLGAWAGLAAAPLLALRLGGFLLSSAVIFGLGVRGWLPRTARYIAAE